MELVEFSPRNYPIAAKKVVETIGGMTGVQIQSQILLELSVSQRSTVPNSLEFKPNVSNEGSFAGQVEFSGQYESRVILRAGVELQF